MKGTKQLLGIALILTGMIATGRAQEDSERGVARISLINGDVSVQRGDSGERTAAAVNAPLVVDDRVATGQGSRTEVQFDNANMVRLAADSEIRLAQVDPGHYQVQVGRGTVIFAVVRDSRAQVEVSTPSVSLRPLQPGAYRISVFPDGHSELTVRLGEAEVYTPQGSQKLSPGSTMMVRGDPSDPEFQMVKAIEQDDFDRWNAGRDQYFQRRTTSEQYVSPDVYGTEELDANGRWVDVPQYGSVWAPTVGPDWVPYRNGRWVWMDWYGWTWVSYDPWGWAPFHYGRWFYSAPYGWCWYPGPIHNRHYWSPALVAFFGFGGFQFGVGFGGPGFGWVPLAPFEPFYHWWGHGVYGGYRNTGVLVRNVNIINNVNIVNTYRNARIGNAVTAVNTADFARGRFTNVIPVNSQQIRQASLVRGQVPIAPTAESLRFSNRTVSTAPHAPAFSGRFFSHTPAPAVNRVPFAQQQQTLSQISRPGSNASAAIPRYETPRAPAAVPQSNVARPGSSALVRPTTPAASSGWRPAEPAPQVNAPAETRRDPYTGSPSPSGGGSAGAGGWRRFGEPAPHVSVAPQGYRNQWTTPGDRPPSATPRGQSYQSSPPSDAWRRFQAEESGSQRQMYTAPASRYSRPEALQIAPPIVRERSAPKSEPQHGSGGGHGSSHVESAPRSSGGGSNHSSGGHSGGSSGGHSGGHSR